MTFGVEVAPFDHPPRSDVPGIQQRLDAIQ
jgi:hypothetical protein